ncbi:LPP20 family lipoprotein [bacterium]|nr:LPP20 family lipoprotein [bacterium]MBU1066021.1 LPP20 family lipoprotein [bacterium]MBU1635833.1 LPP20 family lipoprotein [bacterium]MBU1872563.1 LPP20 family lipoprotein [bacterium]
MKKLIVIALLIPIAFMLMDCGGKPKAKMNDIPEWYLNPPMAEDAIYEAGDAAKQSMGLAKEAADARARDAVSRTIEVKVSNMLKNFMQESGIGADAEALEFTSSVSKQVSNNVLNGARIVKREMKTEGAMYHAYSLAEYNLNSLIQETVDAAKKQKALYNEAKANLSFDDLEKEIQKLDAVGK